MNENLKTLVVDDTIFYRKLLSNLIEEMKGIDLMGVASNGKIAMQKIELSAPDLVLMDVAMPVMDGIEALEKIMANHPGVDVIMVSGVDREAAGLTVKALEIGAMDFVSKPKAASPDAAVAELKVELTPLVALAKTRKYSREAQRLSGNKTAGTPVTEKFRNIERSSGVVRAKPESMLKISTRNKKDIPKIDLVAIGVSTGGPNALKQIIPKISKDLPVPILTVQHMPPMFTATLAESLDNVSSISVVEGKAEQSVENGVMYIAPGGRHMVIRKGGNSGIKLGLVDTPPVHNCRPAVDVLFRSIGMVFGGNVLTVILTGMGNDGKSGVAAIRRKGGYSLVQDKKTCVVWGMPGAVVEANEADEIAAQDQIADRIMEIVKKGRS
ncbi:MAG: chemotaxis-specific protein-glutamate methyltransferase CheB [Thermodesulfobacteriota bacterium]|nr:chemotaxis-specific protein-glutamate methyltransferase CheB [Thermodesulfobacteriota bacterium]